MHSGRFKEEVCSKCCNFMTIPACMKCRVYTGELEGYETCRRSYE